MCKGYDSETSERKVGRTEGNGGGGSVRGTAKAEVRGEREAGSESYSGSGLSTSINSVVCLVALVNNFYSLSLPPSLFLHILLHFLFFSLSPSFLFPFFQRMWFTSLTLKTNKIL